MRFHAKHRSLIFITIILIIGGQFSLLFTENTSNEREEAQPNSFTKKENTFNPLQTEVDTISTAEMAHLKPKSAAVPADWTFMVYIDADNNLEQAGIDDLNELESVGSTSKVEITVQLDRIGGYDASNGNWEDARRYHVEKDSDQNTIGSSGTDIDEVNMGSASTLESFIDWSQTNYPADNYALILWDHGSGAMYGSYGGGVCWDDTNSHDYLTEAEIISAIDGKNIDLLGLDACLMAATEFFYSFRDYADVLVGSEMNEPGDGWPYDDILDYLTNNPSASPLQLGNQIVSDYSDFYAPYTSYWYTTQSAIDGTQMDYVDLALDTLLDELRTNIGTYKSELMDIRENLLSEFSEKPYVDLWDFADEVQGNIVANDVPTYAGALKTAIENAVISAEYTGDVSYSHGMSIYFPETSGEFSNGYRNNIFSQNSQWDEFLLNYFNAPIDDDQFEENDGYISQAALFPGYFGNLVCDDQDYYNVSVLNGDELTVTLYSTYQSGTADLNLYLLKQDNTTIATSETTNDNEVVSWTSDGDQDVIIIVNNSQSGEKISYDLRVYIPIDDDDKEENDDFSSAYDISSNEGFNTTITDLVCIDEDYYNFTLGDDYLVTIELEYIFNRGDLDMVVIGRDQVGDYFEKEITSRNNDEVFQFGTLFYNGGSETDYTVIVKPYNNNTNYNLTITVDPNADDEFDYGSPQVSDYVDTAYDMTGQEGTYKNLVCIDPDYYNITLNEGEWLNVSIEFEHKDGDLDLYLYDSTSGYPVAYSAYLYDKEYIIHNVTSTGDYSILVDPYNLQINLQYNLTIDVSTGEFQNDRFDFYPNDHWDSYADQHLSFPEIQTNELYENLSAWDEDWYELTVDYDQPMIFSLFFNSYDGILVLQLYDSEGVGIDYSFTSAENEHLYYDPSDDHYSFNYNETHYLQVLPLQRLGNYSLIATEEQDLTVDFSSEAVGDLTVSFNELVEDSYLIDSFAWDFGDNNTYQGENVNQTHTYSEIGTYSIYLYVFTTYGYYYEYTETIHVYTTPGAIDLTLPGGSPTEELTFDIAWNISINAEQITLYQVDNSSGKIEDGTLEYNDTTGEDNSTAVTVTGDGTYYYVLNYSNPLGNSTSSVLEVVVQTETPTEKLINDIALYGGIAGGIMAILYYLKKRDKEEFA